MTVKDLRKVTAAYNDISIEYGDNAVTLSAEDPVTLDAYGDYIIESVCIKDEETITATLKLRPVKE